MTPLLLSRGTPGDRQTDTTLWRNEAYQVKGRKQSTTGILEADAHRGDWIESKRFASVDGLEGAGGRLQSNLLSFQNVLIFPPLVFCVTFQKWLTTITDRQYMKCVPSWKWKIVSARDTRRQFVTGRGRARICLKLYHLWWMTDRRTYVSHKRAHPHARNKTTQYFTSVRNDVSQVWKMSFGRLD